MSQVKVSAELLDPVSKRVLSAISDDLSALRAAIVAITAKLDADAGVTDTNYGTTCNPAANSTTK